MPEEFSLEERARLKPYVSNTDKRIFALTNLPEEVKAAVFSRYSRTDKGLRRVLLEEFIENPVAGFEHVVGHINETEEDPAQKVVKVQRAREFFDKVLVGYGDDSVADMGGAHIAVEEVSQVESKEIEDNRLGAYLEKSSRFVYLDQKKNGEFQYFHEPTVVSHPQLGAVFVKAMDGLFEIYSQLLRPVREIFRKSFPLEEFRFKHPETGEEVVYSQIRDGKLKEAAKSAYTFTIRAKTADTIRDLLPLSTLTNIGVYCNGRQFERLLSKLYSSELFESNQVAIEMHGELNQVIPSLVKRAQANSFEIGVRQNLEQFVKERLGSIPLVVPNKPVELLDFEPEEVAEKKIVTDILFEADRVYGHTKQQIRRYVDELSVGERRNIITSYTNGRRNRRDKPGRAFEAVSYDFAVLSTSSTFRDLDRMRMVTPFHPRFTTRYGFDSFSRLREMGFSESVDRALEISANAESTLAPWFGPASQYAVVNGALYPFSQRFNLREAFHYFELRSSRQGHPTYRKITQEMFRQIEKVHPFLASLIGFVDLNDYGLERSDAAVRTAVKESKLGIKPKDY